MIRNGLKSRYLILSAAFLQNSEKSKESSDNFNKYGGLFIEDKWERVMLIFKKDDLGNNHPDFDYTIQTAGIGLIGGAAIGGFIESLTYVQKFIEGNDATLYLNKQEANRAVARQAIYGFTRGMIKGGAMLSVFLGGYMLFSSCLQAYRNKKGIIEYCLGGFGIGALLRYNYGLRGMFSGGLVGGALGTVYGIFNWAKLKVLGMSEDEFRYGQLSLMAYRKRWKEKQLANIEKQKNETDSS